MNHPQRLYELLIDYCSTDAVIEQVLIGLVWTYCQSSNPNGIGLAMSPGSSTRTLTWSGSLIGKSVVDIAADILNWEPYKATVAMATINSCINSRPLPDSVILAHNPDFPNLAVFDYFLPQLQGKKVVVIGRYPGVERYEALMDLTILERQANASDLPDSACEFVLPQADWAFITASSIPNKTFPRLAELAINAKTVLMGPTVPWLPQLHEFGIDYLAGVEVFDNSLLQPTIAQGGGVRIFDHGLRYRVAELNAINNQAWLKQQIADCVAEKKQLTDNMENWYVSGQNSRYPGYLLLELVNKRLSRLDSSFKLLWDNQRLSKPHQPFV